MKTIKCIITSALLASVSILNAQVAVVGGGGSGTKAAIVLPNYSYLTNHAELVGEVFKSVSGVMVNFNPSAGAHSGNISTFYPYTNSVKSLEGIMAMVTNNWWYMTVVDTNAPITVDVQFYNSSDEQTVRGWNPSVSAQLLFEGVNGGDPVRNSSGMWTLPDWAEQVSMRISGSIFVTCTNVGYVHMVTTNSYGGYQSYDLGTEYGHGFWFNPDLAGNGILVLGIYVNTPTGTYYVEHAFDLGNVAVEVPITPVLVKAMLQDSDDFKTSVDSTNLSYTVYSYNGYGKVPLLTPTYTKTANAVLLSLGDQLGNYATSFTIEDQATGQRSVVAVPVGATGVTVTMPKGVYHIIPYGLNLKSMSLYWGWYYGGGKG